MTKAKVVNVQQYKRGAFHIDGSPLMCITCRIEKKLADIKDNGGGRKRARQAVVTMTKINSSGSRLPVGYCENHIPEEIN